MKNAITVYCGSSSAAPEVFLEAAAAVGRAIARRGVMLVTGAGHTGLMGAVVDAALAAGGEATGVIPQFMVDRGWHHRGMTQLEITPDMHARKSRMASLATGVIALPGGIGTFEELTEIITWRQLGLYKGNIVILDTEGYYSGLLGQMAEATRRGFLPADHSALYAVAHEPEEAVDLALAAGEELHLSPKF